MKNLALIIIGLIILTRLIVWYTKNKTINNTQSKVSKPLIEPSISGKNFIDTLAELGYFKYTDSNNLDTLKNEIENVFEKHRVLATTYNITLPPIQPFCYRLYDCDGEVLFELGGLEKCLNAIKPTFEKLNIPLNWKEDYFSEDATEHSIVINDKKYFAFKGDPSGLQAWGIATKNFVEIINDQLAIHKSNERVYPILFNNDGHIIFLTDSQYNFVSQHLDKIERPMEINLWWQTFK